MPNVTKILALVAVLLVVLGIALAPELLLQLMVRGGFLALGVIITLALRPREDRAEAPARLPIAHALAA